MEKWYLETKFWVLGVLTATWVSLSQQTEIGKMYVCTNSYTRTALSHPPLQNTKMLGSC